MLDKIYFCCRELVVVRHVSSVSTPGRAIAGFEGIKLQPQLGHLLLVFYGIVTQGTVFDRWMVLDRYGTWGIGYLKVYLIVYLMLWIG